MSPLRLDFVAPARRLSLSGFLLLLAGLLSMGYVYDQGHRLSMQIEEARVQTEALVPVRRDKPKTQGEGQRLAAELAQANAILQHLVMPWEGLFQVLEEAQVKDVALLSIQPDVGKQSLRIGGEAKNLDALLAYMNRLEQTAPLHQILLSSHEIRTQDRDRPVGFVLSAQWKVAP